MRWTWSVACTALSMLLGMLFITASAVAGSVDWTALFAGEVVLETVQRPDGLDGLRASFAIGAPRERIWTVLLDYAHFPQIFPDIQDMRVLTHDQQGARVEYWVKALVSKYHYVLYRRYDEPGRRLTWTRLAGDLKRIEGSWEIHDTPRSDIQMLVYESYIDIGGVVPKVLVRAEAMRKARAMSERLRHWIEGRPMSE
jgi:ribosome-associated toxin RatA of RatAB toxin-antitoxin module